MSEQRDYYEVLGVPRDADAKAIKNAFRRLARRYHPDTSTEPDAEERFKEIAEAYGVLSDPARRASYDAEGFAGLAGASAEDLWGGIDFAGIFGLRRARVRRPVRAAVRAARGGPAARRRLARGPGPLTAPGANRREAGGLDLPAGALPRLRRQRRPRGDRAALLPQLRRDRAAGHRQPPRRRAGPPGDHLPGMPRPRTGH